LCHPPLRRKILPAVDPDLVKRGTRWAIGQMQWKMVSFAEAARCLLTDQGRGFVLNAQQGNAVQGADPASQVGFPTTTRGAILGDAWAALRP
jgi:hypothetical protein